ncbi:importin-11 [Teleopsis dalmanni]|uniref:importin-11 n=1 Tax=Teleopsis dalmanni TaxID=139649 RepID=UPI0018CDC8AA|nr:importin-11 [Teleopsis dalmanni]
MQAELSTPELMVCQALRAATDQSHEVVRNAEVQLAEWEVQSGFFLTIARICLHPQYAQVDAKARWMAAVYLKNGINKYWRRNVKNEINTDERQQIRELLLTYASSEETPQIALQLAVLTGRIARFDCPKEWPELIPELLKNLQLSGSNAEEQQRQLLLFHHVIKALASRRMMAEKRIFQELTVNIFDFIRELWDGLSALYFHNLKTTPEAALSTLQRATLALRILRKLSVYGYSKTQRTDLCLRFISQLFDCLRQSLQCRYDLKIVGADNQLLILMEKFILKQVKTLTEFQEYHAGSFARFLVVALEFTFDHIFHTGTQLIFTNNVINFQNFAIQCINLMKGIMSCNEYKRDCYEKLDEKPPLKLCDFFTNERLCYMCEKIITHYFILTREELEMWAEDPEGFAQNDGGESWKYALRPAIDNLYLTCFNHYQAQMTEEVCKYIRKAQQIQLTEQSKLEDILLKDAIYNAAGQASFHFFGDVDFDTWFSGQLLNELQIENDNFRILRRRIIWLLAEWTSVKFSRDLRPLAYEACLHLLRPNEDMSIRLAASSAVSNLIGDFEFMTDAFLPYLQPTFNALIVLLREASECETKMNVLNVMSTIIEKMGDEIELQADSLIGYLPKLWKESDDFNMLRCAILSTLQQLVKAMHSIPEQLKPFLYGVIQISTDLQGPSHVYLMEEGLQLWVSVVENMNNMSPELMLLTKNLLPIIEMSSENLRIVLILIQAYILLDAISFLEQHGNQFISFCMRMFDDLRAEGIILMLKVFEICLKCDAQYGLVLIRPALPYIFKQVYINEDFPMLMGMYLTIVARVLLISQNVFSAVLQEIKEPDALEKIFDVWIAKMPLITEVEKSKLFSLAFGSIFTNNPILLERFPSMLQNITDTIIEVMSTDDDSIETEQPQKYTDSLVYLDERDIDRSDYFRTDLLDSETYHFGRWRQLALKDPVHKIVLSQYIEHQLNGLREQLGNENYQRLMQRVYPEVLQKLSGFINLNLNFTLLVD